MCPKVEKRLDEGVVCWGEGGLKREDYNNIIILITMCGITGVISTHLSVIDIIFNGLVQLQNRGYDSAGVCTITDGAFAVDKFASTPTQTSLDIIGTTLHKHTGRAGIGHTRWATHGGKTDANSHPHVSSGGKFALSHNGIIENFSALRQDLVRKGWTFASATDTEVVANLLEKHYLEINNVVLALEQTIAQMQGTWALSVLCIDTPDVLYCTRNGSPLLIGRSQHTATVVSEQSAFPSDIVEYFSLQNMDICTMTTNTANNTLTIATKDEYVLKKTICQNMFITKDPKYPHWMLKEIYEQQDSIVRAISNGGRIVNNAEVKLGGLDAHRELLDSIANVILLGCGTSYNAGLIGMSYFKTLCDFNTVQVFDGADFCENDIPKMGKTALIFLSQSGETKDLHRCLKIAKKLGLPTIGVINVVDSQIAREVDCGTYLNAGKEVGVASTKSFTSQCILLSLIAVWFAQQSGLRSKKRQKIIADLLLLQSQMCDVLETLYIDIQRLLPIFDKRQSCFILGKGQGEACAREGSLKIKEVAYIHSEAYATSSLKHGPFALLDDGFPVVLINLAGKYSAKNANAYHEICSRNAAVIMITDDPTCAGSGKSIICVPQNDTYGEILSVVPMQMLAYLLSISRGINPDMPKNLAKVVTVE